MRDKIKSLLSLSILALACLFPLQVAAASESGPFNPDTYVSSAIKYRSPDAGKPFFAADALNAARGYLVLGYLPEAVDRYKALYNGGSRDGVITEYAYALALSGYNEPAMLYLDSAHLSDPSGAEPYYYAGNIFAFAGYGDIAKNFMKIAQGDKDEFSGLASKPAALRKNIGVISYADLDNDFKKELGYAEKTGVVVLNVFPGPEMFRSPLETRDIIMKIGDSGVKDMKAFQEMVNNKPAGSGLNLTIWRGGEKRNISVKVRSVDDLPGLPALKGRKLEPSDKAKAKLVKAVTLLADKKYFTSILIYRELVDEYPDWEIPYLGYTLALEKAGAFACAKKASEQAAAAAADDKEARTQFKNKSKELGELPANKQSSWRQEQSRETLRDNPKVFYLGFGGGQLYFGGNTDLRLMLNGRIGLLLDTGIDLSASLGIDTSSGIDLGITAVQRFKYGKDFGLNAGGTVAFNTGRGELAVGVLGGGSWYMDSSNSLDLMINMRAYLGGNSTPGAVIYIGTTRFL